MFDFCHREFTANTYIGYGSIRLVTVRSNVSYRTRNKPDLGDISFLKAFPIWAAANGSFPWLNSNSLLKLTKIPWAVSGLRNLKLKFMMTYLSNERLSRVLIYPFTLPVGPISVPNIKLNSIGSVSWFPVNGDLISNFSRTFCNSFLLSPSNCKWKIKFVRIPYSWKMNNRELSYFCENTFAFLTFLFGSFLIQ